MNRLTIRSTSFRDPVRLGEALGNMKQQLDRLGHTDVTLAGDPGEIRITTNVPVDLGLLLYVSDYMKGRGDYTTEVDVIGAGSVELDLHYRVAKALLFACSRCGATPSVFEPDVGGPYPVCPVHGELNWRTMLPEDVSEDVSEERNNSSLVLPGNGYRDVRYLPATLPAKTR